MDSRPLTAIIICYNEIDNIVEAIESVSWCDEVLIIDSFSSDGTWEKIKEHTAVRAIQHEFDGFAEQKNRAIEMATHEWILLVDADERVTPALEEEIRGLLRAQDIEQEGFWIYRDNFFMGKKLTHSWRNDKVLRLFRRHLRYEAKSVHEEIAHSGRVGQLEHHFLHDTYRGKGFLVHLEKGNTYTTLAAKDRYKTAGAVTLYHLWLRPLVTFVKHYFIRLGMLDGREGFVIASLSAWNVFQRYVKIWRLQEGEDLTH